MARIAVGGFQHETNTFAPQQATWDDFVRADAWPRLLRGPEMIDAVDGFNIPIAGAVEAAGASSATRSCRCAWAAAPPSSYVERGRLRADVGAMFDEDLARRRRGPFDAIYLDLHGAMVAENTRTARANCCAASAASSATRMPIVASLDYHANLTPEMVAACQRAGRLPHLSAYRHGGDRRARRRAARPAAARRGGRSIAPIASSIS